MITLTARHESWPLAKPFTISRGTKTAADVVVVELVLLLKLDIGEEI